MVNKPATFTIVTKDAGEGEESCQKRRGDLAGADTRADSLISARFFLQGDCPWLWRAHPRQRSPVRTTRMAHAPCPTCPQHLETIASLCALMTSTYRGVPSQPRSQVRHTHTTCHAHTHIGHSGCLGTDCWRGGEHLEINVKVLISITDEKHPPPYFKRCDHLCQFKASLVYTQ